MRDHPNRTSKSIQNHLKYAEHQIDSGANHSVPFRCQEKPCSLGIAAKILKGRQAGRAGSLSHKCLAHKNISGIVVDECVE